MAGGTDHWIDAGLCDIHSFISNDLLYHCRPLHTSLVGFQGYAIILSLAIEKNGEQVYCNSRWHWKPRIRRMSPILGGVVAA
jgi:hypothetical protein